MLLPSTVGFSARRVLAAVVAAAFAATVIIQFDGTPRAAPSAGVAGEAMMRVLGDEHAAIASYLKSGSRLAERRPIAIVGGASRAHET